MWSYLNAPLNGRKKKWVALGVYNLLNPTLKELFHPQIHNMVFWAHFKCVDQYTHTLKLTAGEGGVFFRFSVTAGQVAGAEILHHLGMPQNHPEFQVPKMEVS